MFEQKGETPEHTAREQGASCGANKSMEKGEFGQKEKGLHALETIPQTTSEGLSLEPSRGLLDHETQQVQDQRIAVRTELEMGLTDPPSRVVPAASSNTNPGVVAGELSTESPQGVRPASDREGINSALRIRGSVLELGGRVKRHPVKVLIDSGATGNFISDKLVTAQELEVIPEAQFEELTLVDGSTVKVVGYVHFKLRYGNYKGDITARVFPNLNKEIILEMPWLVQENPSIDWTAGRVKVQRGGTVLTLPTTSRRDRKPLVKKGRVFPLGICGKTVGKRKEFAVAGQKWENQRHGQPGMGECVFPLFSHYLQVNGKFSHWENCVS